MFQLAKCILDGDEMCGDQCVLLGFLACSGAHGLFWTCLILQHFGPTTKS